MKDLKSANQYISDYERIEIKKSDPRYLFLKTAGHLQGQLELIAKLRGELQEQTTVHVLITHPEWLTLRTAVLNALEPYPDARNAVTRAINEHAHE